MGRAGLRLDGTGEIEIRAAPVRCFDVLTDFESWPDWYGCDRVRVLAGDPAVVEVIYAIPTFEIMLTLRFDAVPPAALDGHLVEASTRVRRLSTAAWRLEPVGNDATRVRYTLDVDLDVPRLLQRIARTMGRELLLNAPLRELKARTEH